MKTCNTAYESLIADILRRQLATPFVTLTPIPTHPDTIVYEAQNDDQRMIFKAIEPQGRDPDGIALEAWAYEVAAAHGVPAPRIYAVDTSCAHFPSSFFIMEKARGRSLADLQISHEELAPLLQEVGRALRMLHTVQLPGFGWLDEAHYRQTGEVRGHASTWRAALLQHVPAGLDYLEHSGALTQAQSDMARQLVASRSALLDQHDDARLLHGDLGPIHVWVDLAQGRLTSIVDFGERSAGDPIWDFVDYDWQGVPDLREGYELDDEMREQFDPRFYFYALLRAIPWAHRWHQRGATHVIDWLTLMIQKAQVAG